MYRKIFSWQDPVEVGRYISSREGDFAFLHSSLGSGHSILAYNPRKNIISNSFEGFAGVLSSDSSKFCNSWFGYLGYELGHDIEKLPEAHNAFIRMPRLWMINFANIIIFDHANKQCELISNSPDLLCFPGLKSASNHKVKLLRIASNMTKDAYCNNVERMIEAIYNGEFYEANLTRKFYGKLAPGFDSFEIFADLCKISPASYSAFLRLGRYRIISSSPEQFLKMSPDGLAETCPIKGSAPRFADKEKDHKSKIALQKSTKDRAENLMIVDLMRNDFARGASVGSVKVSELFKITTHATIHHMSSRIKAKKLSNLAPIEFVKNCFPPGSMTGAPKIKAMECCAKLEGWQRGVYSGALGWFGGDGSLELSVVIRTLILAGSDFEFQVGGAIVADSTAEGEWLETLAKARGICQVLGVEPLEFLS
ncbi:aminodeoxychorismate synthase, component I [Rickettsiales bacterium]|nr:aminodeoxychorismate synthase, component I [Rickettsiales bacterium]